MQKTNWKEVNCPSCEGIVVQTIMVTPKGSKYAICPTCFESRNRLCNRCGEKFIGSGNICETCRTKSREKVTGAKKRKQNIKSRYGITLEEYERILSSQKGLCGECKRKLNRIFIEQVNGQLERFLCRRCATPAPVK